MSNEIKAMLQLIIPRLIKTIMERRILLTTVAVMLLLCFIRPSYMNSSREKKQNYGI